MRTAGSLTISLRKKKTVHKGRKKRWINWWAKIKINWLVIGLGYFGFVMGVAIQGAVSDSYKLKAVLEKGAVVMTHQLTFQDKEQLDIAIIGQNSEFMFYVVKGQRQISVSPVGGIIKSWVPLEPIAVPSKDVVPKAN